MQNGYVFVHHICHKNYSNIAASLARLKPPLGSSFHWVGSLGSHDIGGLLLNDIVLT